MNTLTQSRTAAYMEAPLPGMGTTVLLSPHYQTSGHAGWAQQPDASAVTRLELLSWFVHWTSENTKRKPITIMKIGPTQPRRRARLCPTGSFPKILFFPLRTNPLPKMHSSISLTQSPFLHGYDALSLCHGQLRGWL